MDNDKFCLSIVAIVIIAIFFGFLTYMLSRKSETTLTTAEIEKARELLRRLELEQRR